MFSNPSTGLYRVSSVYSIRELLFLFLFFVFATYWDMCSRLFRRMALALARALSCGSSVRQKEERYHAAAEPSPRRSGRRRRREVTRGLVTFALRLDVIVVSAACAMLLALLVLLARWLL